MAKKLLDMISTYRFPTPPDSGSQAIISLFADMGVTLTALVSSDTPKGKLEVRDEIMHDEQGNMTGALFFQDEADTKPQRIRFIASSYEEGLRNIHELFKATASGESFLRVIPLPETGQPQNFKARHNGFAPYEPKN